MVLHIDINKMKIDKTFHLKGLEKGLYIVIAPKI